MNLHVLVKAISPIALLTLAFVPVSAWPQQYAEPVATEEAAQAPNSDTSEAGDSTSTATDTTSEATDTTSGDTDTTSTVAETTTNETTTEETDEREASTGQGEQNGSPANAVPTTESADATLSAYQEVPVVSSQATGTFSASIDETAGTILYKLTYENLEANATQAHIHLGQKGVNGGAVVTLCTNLTTTAGGPQPCPPPPATISGTIQAANVGAGAVAQGIAAGDLNELIRAIRAGVTYVNVHSTKFPEGETRGQINDANGY
jgi:hypothetical protein